MPTYDELLARWKALLVISRPVDQAKIAAVLGRWVSRATMKDRKVQIVARKNDLRALALALDRDLARALALDRDLALARDLDRDLDRDLARDRALAPYWNYHWLIFNAAYAVAAAKLGRADLLEKFLPIFEAMEAGLFCFWCGENELFASALPKLASFDDRNRLHSDTGPAFAWLEDTPAQCRVHGVLVPDYVVMHPEQISVVKIEAEKNTEVRRVMIDRYAGGQAKYLIDSVAQAISSDDYGTLYRKELPGDEAIVMVKVVNATAEPDGSFKDYFLRVPPTITTAREAVAWTFGKIADDYAPALQT